MKTVHEVSILTGVSVRTLHHYDKIGLLKPTTVTNAGYRLYDDTAIERLQSILLFRELQFSLREIALILENPGFDCKNALKQQICLLELKRKRLDKIISFAREILKTGVNSMDFRAFDKTEIDEYAAEVKSKWGDTDAYKEFSQKSENGTPDNDGLMNIFAKIGEIRHIDPASNEALQAVEQLQQFITDNYYNCTKEILSGLGQMYVADERFKESIDNAGGEGTAEFVSKAIIAYCEK